MNKPLTVLSLFDGMSCGQIALERAGIPVEKYYASEIDEYAIKITQKHYPNTIQLGDVTKWDSWNLPKIDLLIGGSPCQGFSFAGKQLNFEDPRSKLFFVYVDILRHHKPKYFLLENVKMKKEYSKVITELLGVEPIEINSALVSAQQRRRLYWTNIPNITQPQDKHIYLKDIIETGEVDKFKSYCLDANYFKGTNLKQYLEKARRQIVFESPDFVEGIGEKRLEDGKDLSRNYRQKNRIHSDLGKTPTLTAQAGNKGGYTGYYLIQNPEPVALSEVRTEEAKQLRKEHREKHGTDFSPRRGKELKPREDGKANCLLTSLTKDNLIALPRNAADITLPILAKREGTLAYKKAWDSIRTPEDKAKTLMAGGQNISNSGATNVYINDFYIRKLTPVECERLQTVEDRWTEGVSNTQRYRMLGNGWTIDVIAHIFKFMEKEMKGEYKPYDPALQSFDDLGRAKVKDLFKTELPSLIVEDVLDPYGIDLIVKDPDLGPLFYIEVGVMNKWQTEYPFPYYWVYERKDKFFKKDLPVIFISFSKTYENFISVNAKYFPKTSIPIPTNLSNQWSSSLLATTGKPEHIYTIPLETCEINSLVKTLNSLFGD